MKVTGTIHTLRPYQALIAVAGLGLLAAAMESLTVPSGAALSTMELFFLDSLPSISPEVHLLSFFTIFTTNKTIHP